MRRIEAVTVCVDYAEIARYTLPSIRRQVDRLIVVTSKKDEPTKDLCHRLNLEFLETDDFYANGDPFNKGKAIDRGLALLGHDDWLLHIDSDIYLPDDFRESILDAHLEPDTIYGADRLMIVGWDQFTQVRDAGSTRAWHCFQNTGKFPMGSRWVDIKYGYVPIGFFQLWHESHAGRKGIRTRRYPDIHSDAARADVKFALQWDRRQRQVIPEVLVAHIEARPAPMGANWKGRKEPVRFGPDMAASPGQPSVTPAPGRVLNRHHHFHCPPWPDPEPCPPDPPNPPNPPPYHA